MSKEIRREAQERLAAQIEAARANDFFEISINPADFVQDLNDPRKFIGPTVTHIIGSKIAKVTPH